MAVAVRRRSGDDQRSTAGGDVARRAAGDARGQRLARRCCAAWSGEKPLSAAQTSEELLRPARRGGPVRSRSSRPGRCGSRSSAARQIEAEVAAAHPEARLEFRSWINGRVPDPADVQRRPAKPGCAPPCSARCWMGVHDDGCRLPAGGGAAIYLEEYTTRQLGHTGSSKPTSTTWPACRRSSTACWAWRSLCASSDR